MMKKIKELIKKGESESLEFKTTLAEWKEACKSIAAFAWQRGGVVSFGISKSNKIIGVDVGKGTLEQLANNIKQNTDPAVYPSIKSVKAEGKDLILVDVKKVADEPVLAFGRTYRRVGKSSHQLSRSEYKRIILEKHKEELRFGNQICKEATLDDLDRDKVEWFLDKREKERKVSRSEVPYEWLLINLGAVKKINNKVKPTNAGILFFGKNPQRFFIQSSLRVIKFKGGDVTRPVLDRLDCSGNLPEMIDQAEGFIRKNTRLLSYRTEASFRRTDRSEYPIKALREAIINALIHRDYYEPADIRVFIFDDKFEVVSPGRFPEGVTPENPQHKPVNPILCSLTYDIGFIEKYGSGIPMMRRLSREYGNKEPYYNLYPVETKIIFESPIKETTLIELKDVSKTLNDRQRTAVWYLTEHKRITNSEYCTLNNTDRATAYRDIQDMLTKGIIEQQGGGRSTHYVLSANEANNNKL